MSHAAGYATQSAKSRLGRFEFERREPGPNDVEIEILFAGVCHSDIHQARDEWGGSIYPMVPGHEIAGRVRRVGAAVKKFKVGDLAGVGCMVDSCRKCESCRDGDEQYCEVKTVFTYNSRFPDGTPAYGGYSDHIVVDEAFVLSISPKLDLAAVAPLLCAGITTYSPLRHWNVQAGQRIGVIGLGGLGHMALKFAHAFGAHVTQFTTTPGKEADARRLGADDVVVTRDPGALEALENSFHFLIDTVSGDHDLNGYLKLASPQWHHGAGWGARASVADRRVLGDREAAVIRRLGDRRHRADAGDAGFLCRSWDRIRYRADTDSADQRGV